MNVHTCLRWSLGLALAATTCWSQTTATIVGTVTDSSGAAVPNVSITVMSKDTGLTRKATTNQAGNYVAPSLPWGCITSLIDGRPSTGATIIPELPQHLIALEVYARPDSVPVEYQRYTWPNGGISRSGRCSVIVYWTMRARMTP